MCVCVCVCVKETQSERWMHNTSIFSSGRVCVCVCVCVCVHNTSILFSACVCVCFSVCVCVCVCVCVSGCYETAVSCWGCFIIDMTLLGCESSAMLGGVSSVLLIE